MMSGSSGQRYNLDEGSIANPSVAHTCKKSMLRTGRCSCSSAAFTHDLTRLRSFKSQSWSGRSVLQAGTRRSMGDVVVCQAALSAKNKTAKEKVGSFHFRPATCLEWTILLLTASSNLPVFRDAFNISLLLTDSLLFTERLQSQF